MVIVGSGKMRRNPQRGAHDDGFQQSRRGCRSRQGVGGRATDPPSLSSAVSSQQRRCRENPVGFRCGPGDHGGDQDRGGGIVLRLGADAARTRSSRAFANQAWLVRASARIRFRGQSGLPGHALHSGHHAAGQAAAGTAVCHGRAHRWPRLVDGVARDARPGHPAPQHQTVQCDLEPTWTSARSHTRGFRLDSRLRAGYGHSGSVARYRTILVTRGSGSAGPGSYAVLRLVLGGNRPLRVPGRTPAFSRAQRGGSVAPALDHAASRIEKPGAGGAASAG